MKYYNPDDAPRNFQRPSKKPQPTKLRKSISPGNILILLSGRFKGRRVVFLKQLESGLLLISGPYKVNGVPLRRVNQAYVQPTSTSVDVSAANVEDIDDSYFAKKVAQKPLSRDTAWATLDNALSAEEEKRIQDKKERQAALDKQLLSAISGVPMLRKYLSRRFSLRNNMYPHELNF